MMMMIIITIIPTQDILYTHTHTERERESERDNTPPIIYALIKHR